MVSFCIQPKCTSIARYNHSGDPAWFCRYHADIEGGMVNVKDKKCKKCNKGFRKINGLCWSCAKKEGWKNTRICKNENCNNQLSNSTFGICGSCLRKQKCLFCHPNTGTEEFGCDNCKSTNPNYIKKNREEKLWNFLKENFPSSLLLRELRLSNGKITAQIDFLLYKDNINIIIEHDDSQHRNKSKYPTDCEEKREIFIINTFKNWFINNNVILIRFNPDPYRLNKKRDYKNPPLKHRHNLLKKTILNIINGEWECEYDVLYLFYNE